MLNLALQLFSTLFRAQPAPEVGLGVDDLLLESGSHFLLEDGGVLILG